MAPDELPEPDDPTRPSFLERLGVTRTPDGRLVLEVRDGHLRTLGIAHGGVIATLLDSVMGMEAGQASPPDHYVVTAQLNVHYIRPAFDGETLIASSRLRHNGRKTAVAQGEIVTAAGDLVATASATFVHVPHTDRTRANPERLGLSSTNHP